MDGIKGLANGIAEDMRRLLPGQRKTQRENLALLVAMMLDVRSANLMDLAAGLPRDVARIGPLGNAEGGICALNGSRGF